MSRSRALAQTLWLVRRYGGGSYGRTEPCCALLSRTDTPKRVDLNTPDGPSTELRPTTPYSTLSPVLLWKGISDYPCISPILLRNSSALFSRPFSGSRFFTAQPLPAKGSEERKEEREKESTSTVSSETSRKVSASAIDVDKALEDYDNALDRHRKYYASKYNSQSRIGSYLMKALRIIPRTLSFVISLPKMLWSAVFSPWSMKKAWMSSQWKHVKEGAKHYWVGTKLLAMDIRVASRLVLKVLKGKSLSRREKKQLSRTVADLFRMVPMIIFFVVPFLEFLLPVAISLFPNMLPSTFEDKLKKQEQLKKRLTAKLEVAQFLQDTVAVMARDLKQRETGDVKASAAELYQFMKDIRRGVVVHNEDIIRFAQLFNDEFTLDNLDRVHLASLCQLVGLSPFGTDNFLRTRLRAHLGGLKRDDRVIREEGLDTMTTDELRQACRSRAMRALYGDGAQELMKQRMEEWLELSLDRQLPSSLLLLSRAFIVTQPVQDKKTVDLTNLAHTLSTLPDEAVEDVEIEVLSDRTRAENEKKLEYIRREEERIKEEESEMAVAEQVQAGRETTGSVQDIAATATAAAVVQTAQAQMVKDTAQGHTEESAEEINARIASAREQKLKKVLSALAVLSSSSGVSHERSKFMELVQKEIDRIQSEMQEKGGASLLFSSRGLEASRPAEIPEMPQDTVSKRLQDRVAKLMHKIEEDMDKVDSQIGEEMHVCDLDGDGMISLEELQLALGYLREQLGEPELKLLLEELCRAAQKGSRIDVKELLELANKRFDPSSSLMNETS